MEELVGGSKYGGTDSEVKMWRSIEEKEVNGF